MRRSYKFQPTPPREWFGDERAEQVHKENLFRRAASDAEFADAIANKPKYAARRRDQKRRLKNMATAGLARRVSDSKAARTERGAQPKSRSRAQCLPRVVAGVKVNLPWLVSSMEEVGDSSYECCGIPVAMAEYPSSCED